MTTTPLRPRRRDGLLAGWLAAAAVLAAGGLLCAGLRRPPPAGPFDPLVLPDAQRYDTQARRFITPGAFTSDLEALHDSMRDPPGFACLLGGAYRLGASPAIVALGQVALLGAIVLLVGRVATAAGASAAVACGWLVLNVQWLTLPSFVLTETVFGVLVLLALLAVIRWHRTASAPLGRQPPAALAWALSAGVLLAATAYVRAVALYLPIIVAGVMLAARTVPPRRRLTAAAIVLGVHVVLVGAWIARNAAMGGVVAFATTSTDALLDYRAAKVVARVEGIDYYRDAKHVLRVRARQRAGATANYPELLAARRQVALDVLTAHPWQTLRMTLTGLAVNLAAPDPVKPGHLLGRPTPRGIFHSQASWRQRARRILDSYGSLNLALIAWQMLYLLAFWAGVLVGLRRAWRSPHRLTGVLLALTAAYLLLLPAGAEAEPRFRAPAILVLAPLAAKGIRASAGRLLTKSKR